MLKDLTVWRWSFFLRGSSEEDLQVGKDEFNSALGIAITWTNGSEATVSHNYEPVARQSSKRILSIPWSDRDGTGRTVEAREMLDSLYVESGCVREGAVDRDNIAVLKKASVLDGETRAKSQLGEAVCISAEFGQDANVEDLKKWTAEVLREWNVHVGELEDILEVPCGFLIVPSPSGIENWVLLVKDDDLARQRAAYVVHKLFPSLMLALLKVKTVVPKLELSQLREALALEGKIHDQLGQLANQPRRLRILEEGVGQLAENQLKLAETLHLCEELIETLRINLANIERLIDDPQLRDQRRSLDDRFLVPLRLDLDQFSADLRYLYMTQKQADCMIKGIATMAEIRSVRWERTMAVLFGTFAFFEAFHAFPELHEIPLEWRIPLVVSVFGLVLLIVISWLSRKT
jgi:hypothetical protein